MATQKGKSKQKLKLDKARKGKKAEDCSIFVEDMIVTGEAELSEELKKEHDKKSQKK